MLIDNILSPKGLLMNQGSLYAFETYWCDHKDESWGMEEYRLAAVAWQVCGWKMRPRSCPLCIIWEPPDPFHLKVRNSLNFSYSSSFNKKEKIESSKLPDTVDEKLKIKSHPEKD